MSWLVKNHEWLFSGIGVAIVAGLVTLIRSRVVKQPPQNSPHLEKTLQAVLDSEPQPAHPLPKRITPTSILKTIAAAPLLQQPEIQKEFIGLTVSWSGKLVDASKEPKNSVRLMILVDEKNTFSPNYCFFSVVPKKYPGLGLLKKGHKLEFTGRIKEASTYIELEDVTLEFDVT